MSIKQKIQGIIKTSLEKNNIDLFIDDNLTNCKTSDFLLHNSQMLNGMIYKHHLLFLILYHCSIFGNGRGI